ncbi:MAG: DUF2807 domain-containing protein [Sphingomonas sp.]|nr:DUF2807 domain-containing protein [Sphingomonas sp.]
MRGNSIMVSVLALAAAGLAACSVGAQPNQAQASGEQGQRSFEVGEFRSVTLFGPHDVNVAVGGAVSVRAEGDTAVLDGLDIRVEDGVLRVGTQRSWSWRGPGGRATIHVTVPALEGASVTGSGDLTVDRAEAERFAASVTGSGDLDIGALRARQADFSITGSGGIDVDGGAEETEISIAGSGDADLGGFETRRARVRIMGSGDISLRATESVSGSVMGSGDVNVRGGASCSVSRMGSGSVNCAN